MKVIRGMIMDKIKQFTITRVKMKGFKAFKEEKEVHLGNTTYIWCKRSRKRPVLPMLLHMRFAVYRFGVKKYGTSDE